MNGKCPGILAGGKKRREKLDKKFSNGEKRAVSKEGADGGMLGRKGVERSLAFAEHAVRRLREYYEVIGFGTRGYDFLEIYERKVKTVRGKVGVVAKVFA